MRHFSKIVQWDGVRDEKRAETMYECGFNSECEKASWQYEPGLLKMNSQADRQGCDRPERKGWTMRQESTALSEKMKHESIWDTRPLDYNPHILMGQQAGVTTGAGENTLQLRCTSINWSTDMIAKKKKNIKQRQRKSEPQGPDSSWMLLIPLEAALHKGTVLTMTWRRHSTRVHGERKSNQRQRWAGCCYAG